MTDNMNVRATMEIYPRPDKQYQKKRSLDFDMMKTKIFLDREENKIEGAMLWTAHLVCGVLIGILSFMLVWLEDSIIEWRIEAMQHLITHRDDQIGLSYTLWVFSSIVLVGIAGLMTVYYGPGAMGSGVAEVMGLLNGINYPDAISFPTLITKCFGTLFAVTGGLCIGKEGPLVHIGANIGVLSCYLPFRNFEVLQNDLHKRQMIAAGASAGVSVAFGAPIGGALFSYEISKPNTFWTFSMLWRVFGCTSIACFTLSILNSLATGSPLSLADSGSIKFGTVSATGQNAVYDLPSAVVLGVVTGLMGALFIHCAILLSLQRKKYVNTKAKKVLECCVFALLTSTAFYAVVAARDSDCSNGEGESLLRFSCPDNQYNPLATLIFNTEGGTLRQFFRYPQIIADSITDVNSTSRVFWNLIIYLILWFFFTTTTYGIWVPAGIFVPGMIIGCTLGLLYLQLMLFGFNLDLQVIGGQSYMVIGASAMLSSYTRLTYSLAVIMLETTDSINIFLPILLSIFVSHAVARQFNRSIYEYSIRAKQMPLLRNHLPKATQNTMVKQLMDDLGMVQSNLDLVESVCSVERLMEVLTAGYSSIAVVNMHGALIGLVPKHFIIVLIQHHSWYERDKTSKATLIEDAYETSKLRRSTISQSSASQRALDIRLAHEKSRESEHSSMMDSSSNLSPPPLLDSSNRNSKSEEPPRVQIEECYEDNRADSVVSERGERLKKFTTIKDNQLLPVTKNQLSWRKFIVDFWSSERDYHEVLDIGQMYGEKLIDLRPYMIELPFFVLSTDKLTKVLDLFRHFHLRALPVNDPMTNLPVAVLTRQDIFAYCSV